MNPTNANYQPDFPNAQPPAKRNIATDKILGYVLLFAGLALILVSTFSLYQVFTGRSNPPAVINTKSPTIKLPTAASGSDLSQLPPGVSSSLQINQPGEVKLIADDVFNRYLNSGFYYLAMMFAASSGMKIAGIGVNLIKDIKVQIKEEKIKT